MADPTPVTDKDLTEKLAPIDKRVSALENAVKDRATNDYVSKVDNHLSSVSVSVDERMTAVEKRVSDLETLTSRDNTSPSLDDLGESEQRFIALERIVFGPDHQLERAAMARANDDATARRLLNG